MKNIIKLLTVLVVAGGLSSCAVSYPIGVTNNKSVKTGEVSQNILFWGWIRPMDMDLSLKAAAEAGGITKIATADFTVETKLLGFKMVYTTKVSGE